MGCPRNYDKPGHLRPVIIMPVGSSENQKFREGGIGKGVFA